MKVQVACKALFGLIRPPIIYLLPFRPKGLRSVSIGLWFQKSCNTEELSRSTSSLFASDDQFEDASHPYVFHILQNQSTFADVLHRSAVDICAHCPHDEGIQ